MLRDRGHKKPVRANTIDAMMLGNRVLQMSVTTINARPWTSVGGLFSHWLFLRLTVILLGMFVGSAALALAQVPSSVPTVVAEEDMQPFTVETLADGLDFPWALAFLPNGDVLITERTGKVRLMEDGALRPAPLANTPEPFVGGQGGYFDILSDPGFSENRLVYLALAVGTQKQSSTQIVRARLGEDGFSDVTPLFTSTPRATSAHYGGKLLFLPDGTLVLTLGDGYQERERAQGLGNTLGKIIRIKTDGSIPGDNPFVGRGDAVNPAIYTYGHRSPQGLVRDPKTGTVYMHEHGPQGGDEINIVSPGANYGWPIATYGIDYSGARISPFQSYEGTRQPIRYWVPSIAPSGFAFYRGSAFPDYDGDLFVGALAGRALHRVQLDGDRVVGEEVLLKAKGERIREVRVGPDGMIYVLTDGPDGKLWRLTPRSSRLSEVPEVLPAAQGHADAQ